MRERTRDERPCPAPEPEAAEPQNEEARQDGEELLAAGDEAIRRALSGDSEGFLRANRQEGGQ